MALATQCPHCHTTFRVAHDQLKLRAGLVRCGSCKQIFNGIENLLRPEELAAAPPSAVPKPQPAAPAPEPEPTIAPVQAPVSGAQSVAEDAYSPVQPAQEPGIEERPASFAPTSALERDIPVSAENTDPLLRMTLVNVDEESHQSADNVGTEAPAPQEPDRLEQTLDDLQQRPWRKEPSLSSDAEVDALDQVEAAGYEEPAFVRQARRRQRIGRVLRVFMVVCSLLLLLSLLAQAAYVFRDQIAVRFPQARPALVQACAYLDCQVGLPAQIESVSLESSELQALSASDNTFTLTMLLRNHGATAQAWPHIELTLNDANEKAIARRVFMPRDYLPPQQDFSQGFAPGSEQPIKLFFEFSKLKASGYRVYLFYP